MQAKDQAKDRIPMKIRMSEDKGVLTIQTDDLALQAIFPTPILQQVQKFNYRAALSSVNLKVNQFQKYYSTLKERIDNQYNSMVNRSVLMIHDLLVSLRLTKIQLWRQQAAITNLIRTNLYMKTIDPYQFNPAQFLGDTSKVIDQLKTAKADINLARETIAGYADKLKMHESDRMDEMFAGRVQQPYLAQNKDCRQVDPSSIYHSYLRCLKIRLERSDQSLIRHHFAIHQQIFKFAKYACDHCIKYQRTASNFIRKYNDRCKEDTHLNYFGQSLQFQTKRQFIDADQLSVGRQQRFDSKSALRNRVMTVQFAEKDRVLDFNTGREDLVWHPASDQLRNQQKEESNNSNVQNVFSIFAARRGSNPQQFFQLREYQKKRYYDEEIKQRTKDRQDKERTLGRRVIYNAGSPPDWNDLVEHPSPFIHMYVSSQHKENQIWEVKSKFVDNSYTRNPTCREDSYFSYRATQEKTGLQNQSKNYKHSYSLAQQQQANAYESRRIQEEGKRLNKIKAVIQGRSYQQFIKLSNLNAPQSPICDSRKLIRYGLILNSQLQQNNQQDVDRFFFYYFKQRCFRQNEKVKENNDIPLIFLDSSKVNMSSSSKTVSAFISSMLKKIQAYPFLLVWSQDLVVYHLCKTQEGEMLDFECYCFVSPKNSQKLMYELRRRTQKRMRDKIIVDYISSDRWDSFYSKVQIAHRLIFDRHLALPDLQRSSHKGKCIVKEIIQQLCD